MSSLGGPTSKKIHFINYFDCVCDLRKVRNNNNNNNYGLFLLSIVTFVMRKNVMRKMVKTIYNV